MMMNLKNFSAIYIVLQAFICISLLPLALAEEGEKKTLKTAGCKTAYYLIHDLARGFKSKTGVPLDSKRTGNKVALKLLAASDIDFASTCKHHKKLVKKFNIDPDAASHWVTMTLANDPIVVLVNRNNPVVNISTLELNGIFTGKITNWKELGGDDIPIKVAHYNHQVGSGVLTVFREIVVGRNRDGSLKDLLDSAVKMPGPTKIGAYVSQNPGGITFMGYNSFQRRYGSILNINNFAPNRENIINGSYPLTATYHIVFDKRYQERLAPFFDYIQSTEGVQLANQSFVSNINMP